MKANLFFMILLSPYWLGHFFFRRIIRWDRYWTLQQSIDLVWAGDATLGMAQREVALEEKRQELPRRLYAADVFLHYGRVDMARMELTQFLADHPNDERAVALLRKAEDFKQ